MTEHRNTLVFVPEFPWGRQFATVVFFIVAIAFFVLVPLALSPSKPEWVLVAIFSGAAIYAALAAQIKRIRFEDKIIIERYFLADREIDYKDVVGIGNAHIKLRKGRIVLHEIRNVAQLESMFFEAVRFDYLSPSQLDGGVKLDDVNMMIAHVYAAALSGGGLLILSSLFFPHVMMDERISNAMYLAVFLLIYWIVYKLLKRQSVKSNLDANNR